ADDERLVEGVAQGLEPGMVVVNVDIVEVEDIVIERKVRLGLEIEGGVRYRQGGVRGGPTGGQVEVVKEGVDGRGLVARAHRVRCGRQGATTPGAQAGIGLVEEVPGGNGRSLAVAGEEFL